MSLMQRLQNDMKDAMKAGQKQRLAVIRMMLNEVKNIDLAPKKVSEEEAVEAYGKKLRKTAEEFDRIGKKAEADAVREELAIVEQYLPQKASPAETEALVDQFLAQHNFTEKQFGQAMGAFMKAHGGEVDAATANGLIKSRLAGK